VNLAPPHRLPVRLAAVYRIWCAWLGFVGVYAGYGLHAQPELYATAVFESVRYMAPLPVWSAAWMIAGILCLAAAVLDDVRLWLLGGVGSLAIAASWFVGITWEWVVDGEAISPTGWVLWASLMVAQLLAMFGNRQLSHRSPLFHHVPDDIESLLEVDGARRR